MKKYPFFHKAIYVLFPAILYSGELLVAQSDPGVDSEVIQAMERLEVTINSLENSIRYTAPEEDMEVEAMYALERLEQFVAETEKELNYEAPFDSDKNFDFYNTEEERGTIMEYLTEIPVFNVWLNIY